MFMELVEVSRTTTSVKTGVAICLFSSSVVILLQLAYRSYFVVVILIAYLKGDLNAKCRFLSFRRNIRGSN
jgi:hypothetical protein